LLSVGVAARRPIERRGASLLELLIGTAILATVLGIGVPSLLRLQGPYVLRAAAQQVAADLHLARQRAIARNTRYRVAFGGTGYAVERETGPSTFVPDLLQTLPHGAAFGSVSPGDPVFDTRGMLNANVTVPVTVEATGTKMVTINVLGRTTIN
jgi:type II secretory pathway pseudopilin PulG